MLTRRLAHPLVASCIPQNSTHRVLSRTFTTPPPTVNVAALWMAAWMKDGNKFDDIWNLARSSEERRSLAFASNEHGWNALHHAAVHNQTHMIQKLAEESFGRELAQSSTRNGWRPLHYASGFGQKESVDLLLKVGAADLEIQNDRSYSCLGWTPFHRAIRWWLSPGKPNCIEHLLTIGVNAAATTHDGKTAAHIANPEVHEALELALVQHLTAHPHSKNRESVEKLRAELRTVVEQWATMGK